MGNQKRNGGWIRTADGKLEPRQGGKIKSLSNIFGNPDLPEIDYYEPFDLIINISIMRRKAKPRRRPDRRKNGQNRRRSQSEDDIGTEFSSRSRDVNFEQVQKDLYGEFENTFTHVSTASL